MGDKLKSLGKKLADSELVIGAAVILVVLAYFYLRDGSEYFFGNSGGAYWDNMNYCETHHDGQMKIYKQLVSCRDIVAYQGYCKKHLDESITIDGTNIRCDTFLDVEDDGEAEK